MTSFEKLDTEDSNFTRFYGKIFCYFVPFEYGLANTYLIGGKDVFNMNLMNYFIIKSRILSMNTSHIYF